MTAESNPPQNDHPKRKMIHNNAAPVYGLGVIGALVYYIQHAATFWIGVLGFFKAVFWPAMLVYKLLEFLKM
jgi:hypothetical protein